MDQSLLRKPIYSKLLALYDNYDVSKVIILFIPIQESRRCPRQVDTSRREAVSQSELREEDDFLDEVLKTDVMRETMRFHHLMIKYV